MVNMRKRECMCGGGSQGGEGYLSEGKRMGHRADEDLTQFAVQV